MPHGKGIAVGQPWGALSQAEALRLAANPDTGPLHMRLFLVAVGRANTIGHATFAPGELPGLLPRRDGTSPHRTHLANAIRRAVASGLLQTGSGTRCLLPAADLWDRAGGKGTRTCHWHGIGRGSRRGNSRSPPRARHSAHHVRTPALRAGNAIFGRNNRIMTTITAAPPAPAFVCDVEDDDPLNRHLICADRDSCAFAEVAELMPAELLPEFYREGDRAERLWIADAERSKPLADEALNTLLDGYRRERALDLRNDTERRRRIDQLQQEASRCHVCRRPGMFSWQHHRPAPIEDADDSRVPVALTNKLGQQLGATVRVSRPRARSRADITRLPRVTPMGQRFAFTAPNGRRVSVMACADCERTITVELAARSAAAALGDGRTVADAVRYYLDGTA